MYVVYVNVFIWFLFGSPISVLCANIESEFSSVMQEIYRSTSNIKKKNDCVFCDGIRFNCCVMGRKMAFLF